eukprot:2969213-Rhodomonas_salina.3
MYVLRGTWCRIPIILATIMLVLPSVAINRVCSRLPLVNSRSHVCGYIGCPNILVLRGGALEEEEDREAQALRDMGLGGSSDGSSLEDVFDTNLIDGTLKPDTDSNFTCLLLAEGGPELREGVEHQHLVTVNYYDLASGGTRNISQWYPDMPHITGFWQLGVRVHGWEWTFCAHR